MNVEGVELGKTLADLKEFTAAFDPQMKGTPGLLDRGALKNEQKDRSVKP